MSKKDKPVYAFIRRGNHLVPELAHDLRALEGVAQNQRVKVEVKEFRNLGRHRAYWAMLGDCIDATECALHPLKLHEIVKLKTGVVEFIELPSGEVLATPGSISFDAMAEDEFVAFFKAAERWLAETYGFINERAPNARGAAA